MTKVGIKLYDQERGTTFDLMEEDGTLSTGDVYEIDDGVKLTHEKMYMQKGGGGSELVQFTLDIAQGVGASVAGAYIYDKLKNRDIGSLEIGGKETEVNEDKIQKRLEDFHS